MFDVTYRQRTGERQVVAILQEIYLCVSVEFLMAVADFFLQSLPQSSVPTTTSVPSDRLKLRQTTEPRLNANTGIKAGGGTLLIITKIKKIKSIKPRKLDSEINHFIRCLFSVAPKVRTLLRGVVVDPEVAFVASLMKADAPALVASFQCDFTLQVEEDAGQNMRASLRDVKLLACPLIQDKENKAVTTVRSQHFHF